MSTAVARNLMAEMKLLGMFESFDRLLTEATRDQWSCAAFFDAVLQAATVEQVAADVVQPQALAERVQARRRPRMCVGAAIC